MKIISFDIGGTWFRSCVYDSETNDVSLFEKVKAINYKNTDHIATEELQDKLCNYIIEKANQINSKSGKLISQISISMGAALNGNNGYIYNSGPLWGPNCTEVNLKNKLQKLNTDYNYTIVNDVTASLLANINKYSNQYEKRIALMTISSGIAFRTYDKVTCNVPIDKSNGLQGEIGHIQVDFKYDKKQVNLKCDCGGNNHLNAFCSGRGIISVIKRLKKQHKDNSFFESIKANNDKKIFEQFLEAIKDGNNTALKILNSVTDQLSKSIINIFTIDPEIEILLLTGGVVSSLGEAFKSSLFDSFKKVGMYQTSNRFKQYFENKIRFLNSGDYDGLIGAAEYISKTSTNNNLNNDKTNWEINENKNIKYKVKLIKNVFENNQDNFLKKYDIEKEFLIFIDENVYQLYSNMIRQYFDNNHITYNIILVKIDETKKNTDTLINILNIISSSNLQRRSNPIIAIGGGVLTDIVGFACSMYRRGTPYIKIPTTLLGIVDAGIGIKTAVNFDNKKNRIGSYFPPIEVLLDPSFIKTQSKREIVNGLSEMLKIGIILNKDLFLNIEKNWKEAIVGKFQDDLFSLNMIKISIDEMLRELKPNLYEKILKRKVDFGHTFSPLIEMKDEKILHGEAVAIDMAISSVIANHKELLSYSDLNRILSLMTLVGLPTFSKYCTLDLLNDSLLDAIKHRNGKLRMPIPNNIGNCIFENNINKEDLNKAVNFLKRYDSDKK